MVGAVLMVVDEYVWLVSLAWIAFMVPATWLYHIKFMVKDGTIVFPQFVTGWEERVDRGWLARADPARHQSPGLAVSSRLKALRRLLSELAPFLHEPCGVPCAGGS